MQIEYKHIPLSQVQIKAVGEAQGIIEGYASVFGGTPDSYGDLIVKGAFAESLRLRTPKLLWQHDPERPIALAASLEEDDHGLYGKWQFSSLPHPQEAYGYIKEGLVEGLSIGFIADEYDWNEEGFRVLRKIDLREISAVTLPANEAATISAVKSDLPFDVLLRRVQDGFALALREAKALAERRAADHRALNDRHTGAITAFAAEAQALLAELDALLVVGPPAEAQRLQEMRLLVMRQLAQTVQENAA